MDNKPLAHRQKLLDELKQIAGSPGERIAALQKIADALRLAGNYRWVGLYDVDHATGMVRNLVWSGSGAPAYPTFPLTKGLTSAAITSHSTVNVGDVSNDPRYLTAFGSTRSEIIVPVFDHIERRVIGTIDVESELPNAFGPEVQKLLEECAVMIRSLWDTDPQSRK